MTPDAICRIDRLTHVARALSQEAQTIQANLANAERRFQATFLHAPVGIAHVALDGTFLTVNPRFEEITGYSAAMLMRLGFQQITHPDDLDADVALLGRLHRGELQRYTLEKRYIRADASLIWINLTVALVRDERDEPEFYVAVVEDLSEMRQAHFDAIHDPLTGLLNRRGFLARVENAGDGAVALIDLDKFKSVNDRFGHDAGDTILQDFAAFLARGVRKSDCVGRWGGEEFAVFFPATEESEAAGILQRLCRRLANGLIERPDGAPMTCSGGIVALDGEPLRIAMARADAALYAAKRSGRNQLRVGDGHILAH